MRPLAHEPKMAGYTLVELLVVLAIMGMLAAVALPMLSGSRPGLEAKAAARAVAEDLKAARQEAIDRGIAQHVVFVPAAGRYAIAPNGARHTLPKDIALAVQGAAHDEIDFYPDGSSSGGVILISDAGSKHRVTVRWPAGQIAVDD